MPSVKRTAEVIAQQLNSYRGPDSPEALLRWLENRGGRMDLGLQSVTIAPSICELGEEKNGKNTIWIEASAELKGGPKTYHAEVYYDPKTGWVSWGYDSTGGTK